MSKTIKKSAKSLLKSGMTKDDALYKLLEEFKGQYNRIQIAKVLRFLPSKEQQRKFGLYNLLILIILIVIDISYIITLNYTGLVMLGLLTYVVATKNTKYYYWLSVLGALIIVLGIAMSFYGSVVESWGMSALWVVVTSIVIGGIFLAFGYVFPKRFTPNYDDSENEEYTAEDGTIQLRKKIKFF